jgi:hypothetical protein
MTFQLVHYSQQDPKWKGEILGFGEAGDTIGFLGCALTSAAMLLSGHGFHETPKSLNEKIKKAGGFAGAGIRWDAVSRTHPQVIVKSNVSCINTDAPLSQIDASIAAGQPVIVMVDSSPVQGLLTHWVLLAAKEGDDYLMLDPWLHQADLKKRTLLTPRYSQGRPLRRSIMHAIILECLIASGEIAKPGEASASPDARTSLAPARSGSYARVKADLPGGLNIRSSIDTAGTENLLVTVPAGTLLTVVDPDGPAKVGAVNQFIRVRTLEGGEEGLAAAWHLEKAALVAPVPSAGTSPVPMKGSPASATFGSDTVKLIVVVRSGGAKVYKSTSAKSELLSKEKAGARLVVAEPLEGAITKIGLAGKWLTVKATNGKRGCIDAGAVKEG